jgi:pimeloyl-ACP methyl ester carboxylesterase
VGGGGDDWFTHAVENYAAARGSPYYSWTQGGSVVAAIREATARGEPVNVIGHSFGGATAMSAIGQAAVEVDSLITIDPVGGVLSSFRNGINVEHWVNVTANPNSWDRSDLIAWVGGKTSNNITSAADEQMTSKQHHAGFPQMMREINADARLREVNEQAGKAEESKRKCDTMDYRLGKC